MKKLWCIMTGHNLKDEYEILQWIHGDKGVGVIVERACPCGKRRRLGHAFDVYASQ